MTNMICGAYHRDQDPANDLRQTKFAVQYHDLHLYQCVHLLCVSQ